MEERKKSQTSRDVQDDERMTKEIAFPSVSEKKEEEKHQQSDCGYASYRIPTATAVRSMYLLVYIGIIG